jgi:hypothetical protein
MMLIISNYFIYSFKNITDILEKFFKKSFQMCCDFFDYAEEIIGLQNAGIY